MNYAFLQGGGEMGEYARNYDWSSTSLGDPGQWPQSLQTMTSLVLRSRFPMFLWWGKDLVQIYNDAYRPGLGYDGMHPHIFGKKGADCWPHAWHIIEPMIQQVLNGESLFHENLIIPNKRGGVVVDTHWTFSYTPVAGESGQIEGVAVTCLETTVQVEDLKKRATELENAHDSLLEANSYLQTIINFCKEPIQALKPVYDSSNKIVDFTFSLTNAAYAAYANTTPEGLSGKKVSEFFPGYFQTSSFTNVTEVFETGIAQTWDINYREDGLDLHNLMSATKVEGEVIVHFTDFTKLKHLQIALENTIEELRFSNEHLEEFAHAASHDLKEPIRKIKVFTDQLRRHTDGSISEKGGELLSRIESATGQMGQLVDDLLQYSHVSNVPREKEIIPLQSVITHVLEDLDLDIQEKHASVVIDQLPDVKGYRRQLQQMFLNVVGNALKYSKPGISPVINLQASKTSIDGKPYDEITIRDNGIGFDEKYAERIFDMFTRLHAKTEYGGTGIGLAIVKKVIENHKGFIRANSVQGEGTMFTILLPG